MLKSRKVGSIKGFDPYFLSDTRDKWLLIANKNKKLLTKSSIDDILTKYAMPMNRNNPLGR